MARDDDRGPTEGEEAERDAHERQPLVPRPHEQQPPPMGRYPAVPINEVALAPELYAGAATGTLSPSEQAALTAPIPEEWWAIKPTGELYLPQIHYRDLLNRVVGATGWAMMPVGDWRREGDLLCREWHLLIRGRFAAMAVGKGRHQPGNQRAGDWADAAEACKSNALMRCAKDLGIAAPAWDPVQADRLRALLGVQVWVDGKPRWRLRSGPPFRNETGEVKAGPQSTITRPQRTDRPPPEPGPGADVTTVDTVSDALAESVDHAAEMRENGASARDTATAVRAGERRAPAGSFPISKGQIAALMILCREHQVSPEALHAHLQARYGLASVKDISTVMLEAVRGWVGRQGTLPSGGGSHARTVRARPRSRPWP